MKISNSIHGLQRKILTWVKPVIVGIFGLLLLTVSPVMSQEPEEKIDPKSISPEEDLPSLEFLEFLGEFETEDGTWTGPEDLEELILDSPEQNDDDDSNKK
jgi:hypothetical protein